MKPLYLYIEDFMGHECSELQLSAINLAIIIGNKNGNEIYSNAVGKSTIFKAIEFCIFNEAEKGLKLEELIRIDTNKCRVVFDFEVDKQIYRISRSRTKKGSTDLSLYVRTAYVEPNVNPHSVSLDEDEFKKFWTDISSRRAADTEDTLFKIIKITYGAFNGGYHFVQNDYTSGLATTTKGQRKEILKNSLGLNIYTSLAKLATLRHSALTKEFEKKKTIFEMIANPEEIIKATNDKIITLNSSIENQKSTITTINTNIENQTTALNSSLVKEKLIAEQVGVVQNKKKGIELRKVKAENSVNDSSTKRKNLIVLAKNINVEIEKLKTEGLKLAQISLEPLSSLKVELEQGQEIILKNKTIISSLNDELVELRIPLPNEAYCKHCRQPLTAEHRRECEKSTNESIGTKEKKIADLKKETEATLIANKSISQKIIELENTKKLLESNTNDLVRKEKDIVDKKELYLEYDGVYKKYKSELDEILVELAAVDLEIEASSVKELVELQKQSSLEQDKLNVLKRDAEVKNRDLNNFINEKTVNEHLILQKTKDIQTKKDLSIEILKSEEECFISSLLTEAFGPIGIPNLIIQNILDDFQIEANNILERIQPGLQLVFSIEKTKGDGQLGDDLDIDYFLNGKSLSYPLLSGAQKLSVMFALKLGQAYLHKKILGSTIQFLLLDELDQGLDKAGIDTFAEVVKSFQNDFTILVITHNDRLKDKFTQAILVEQDLNMASRARIITY